MLTATYLLVSVAAAGSSFQGEVIDFSAKWCGPCQQMSPIVSRLERNGYPIRKVDVDSNPDLARKFGVKSIPAFVLVIHGKEAHRVVGMTSESQLKRMMAKIPRKQKLDSDVIYVDNDDNSAQKSRTAVAAADNGNAAEPAKTQARRSSTPDNIPLVKVSDGPKRKGFGFDIPFFGKDDNDGSDRAVELEPERPPVMRAKFAEGDSPPQQGPPADPRLASSTRIRVKDGETMNFGSGTVIDSQSGRTIVLTCGHILRELSDEAVVEVDLFRGNEHETFVATVVDFDLDADVGLIAIPTEHPVAICKVAAEGTAANTGDPVVSVGCSQGELPSPQELQVTALNRYTGPDNIECTGVPVQGRSGGALFNGDGDVLGVCIAADSREKRGLYAGLAPIQQLLVASNLGHVFGHTGKPAGNNSQVADAAQQPANTPEALAKTAAASGSPNEATNPPESRLNASQAQQIPEALSQAGDAEVICIIRPLDDPNGSSRIVIINRATSKFLADLRGELESQPRETMHSVNRFSNSSLMEELATRVETVFQAAGARNVTDEIQTAYRAAPSVCEAGWQPPLLTGTADARHPSPTRHAAVGTTRTSAQTQAPQRYRRSPESRR